MKFLLDYGFTQENIDEVIKRNDNAIIKNLELNKDNVIEVIKYLTKIGVSDEALKDLFLHQVGMFFRTKSEIESVFDEYEIESIIKSLNYDVNTVDLIEFS